MNLTQARKFIDETKYQLNIGRNSDVHLSAKLLETYGELGYLKGRYTLEQYQILKRFAKIMNINYTRSSANFYFEGSENN